MSAKDVVLDDDVRQAIQLLESKGYTVFKRVYRRRENTGSKVLSVLTNKPQDIHTITIAVYGENYTIQQQKRVGHSLRTLRNKGLVVRDGEKLIRWNWVSCWRLA